MIKLPKFSKKLTVCVLYSLLVVGNRKFGLGLSETEILSIAGVAATYLGAQGIVDYGRDTQDAINLTERVEGQQK